jgi:uncharacterized protein (DUF697 family)
MSSETEIIRRGQARKIIRNAAIASSTAAGAVAQVAPFGADLALSVPIVVNMVIELGKLFEQSVSKSVATTFVSYLIYAVPKYYAAKYVVGLVPIVGNIVSAAVTYPLIELSGWTIYEVFRNNNDVDLSNITKEEIQAYMKRVAKERDE